MDYCDSNVVVAHDQMWDYGGAERVAIAIGKAIGAPVFVPYAGSDAKTAAEAADVELVEFAANRYEGIRTFRRKEGLKSLSLTLDWQTAPLEKFDLIFSAHMFSRHYRTLDHQYMINYCHSPPRWFNDLLTHRTQDMSAWFRSLAKLYASGMDVLDERSTRRVDSFIANSEVIQDRIRRYYRRDSTVIYPPIDTSRITSAESSGEYYLMIGRVVKAKRPHVVVEAFADIDAHLKIAGGPANEPALGMSTYDAVKEKAGSNVEFLGYVSDEEKRKLLRDAKAVIYIPIREDFGMVPIEALAAGTPVIAANEGFPQIAIEDGVTGAVVEPTVEGLKEGIRAIEAGDFDSETLSHAAEAYSTERFEGQIRNAVNNFLADPQHYRKTDDPLIDR